MLCFTKRRCLIISVALIACEILFIFWSEIKLHLLADIGEEELNGYADSEPAESFLQLYQSYCGHNFYPKMSNVPARFMPDYNASLCACVPNTLVGRMEGKSTAQLNSSLREVQLGGTWSPRDCVARQRIAVVIPFRDRHPHLTTLLPVLHAMLQRQQVHYTVYVVEQKSPDMFNKAVLMNAAFREATADGHYDCFIFQDVDMVPEDDRNFYVCSAVPRHIGSHLAQWNYKVRYYGIFGGVTAFTRDQFVKINGFSNEYYGWGGEDDDMYSRIIAVGYHIVRFPQSVARYHMIDHDADHRNPYNVRSSLAWRVRPKHYQSDGLSNVQYTRLTVDKRLYYTWIYVTLPDPPRNFKGYKRTFFSSTVGLTASSLTQLVTLLFLLLWDSN